MQQVDDLHGRAENALERTGLYTKPADDPLPPGIGDAKKVLSPKEFYWDRIATIIITGILGLTFVDVVAEFFRQSSSTVLCNTPSNFTRDQTAFVNSFCFSSLPSAQYYTFFITVHGLLLIAPHQLWTWLFSGYVEYFFDLAKSLDRLKNSKTGEYESKNTAVVSKLEKEFLSKDRWIFPLYKVKLFLQLAVASGTLAMTWTVLQDFTVVFQCPQNGSKLCSGHRCSFDDSWPSTIDCAYIPLQLLSVLRYVDVSLVSLLILVLLYGVAWCYQGHPTELGAEKMAQFAFTSCLLPETYVFPSTWSSMRRRGLKGIGRGLFSPGIKNDLDFLLLQLFQADSGHGQVFKEIQVAKEYRRLYSRDHELLHLFVNLQQDMRAKKEKQQRQPINNDIEVVTHQDTPTQGEEGVVSAQNDHTPRSSMCVPCCKRKRKDSGSDDMSDSSSTDEDMFQTRGIGGNRSSARKRKRGRKERLKEMTTDRQQAELKTYFRNAGFDGDPEKVAYLNYKPDLGNTKWTDIESIRSRFYGFVQFAPDNDVAMDISFGSVGYTLALARAFRTAMSINLHEFYKEDEPKKQSFYTNYYTFMFPQDVFSRSNLVLNKMNQCVYEEFDGREHKISFIVVGPIDDQSKITTVNLLINTFYTTKFIEEGAILLAVRPLQIEQEVTADKYFRYKPSKSLFDPKFHRTDVKPKLKDADRKLKENGSRGGLFQTVRVGKQKYEGLRISCADTECVFEFKAYKFNAEGYDSGKRRHRAPRKAAPPIVVAHPAPSAVPQLQSQSSTDGEEATVRSGGCPQPLHIPSSTHRGHSAQREDEEDQRVLMLSEEEGVASPHDSNKYGGPTTVETNL
eukprot:Em0003g167a